VKKLSIYFLFLLFVCTSNNKKVYKDSLTYWCATNPQEYQLAKLLVEKWNKTHTIKVKLQPIPAGNSSEEVIMAAIAGKTTPDIYSNHWPGMTEELRVSGNLYCLDSIDGALDFLINRCGDDIVNSFKSKNRHLYQVPWKVNPIMIMYNKDFFKRRGVNKIPVTYDDFLEAAGKLTYDEDNDGYIDHWAGYRDIRPLWYQRWFDFYAFYIAASGGKTLFDKNGKFNLDDDIAIKVFSLFKKIYENGYFPKTEFQNQPFILKRVIATDICGPWNISTIKYFKVEDLDYGFFKIPVPDTNKVKQFYTYGDYKNIVIFRTCNMPDSAWEFVKFLITRKSDLELLKITNQIPVRRDLLKDSLFIPFFNKHKDLIPFAKQAILTRSINSVPEIKEIFDEISQQWEACCIYGVKSPEDAISDLKKRVNLILNEF